MAYAHIPDELKQCRQWVNWLAALDKDHITKVPVYQHGGHWRKASTTDPATWRSFDEVVAADAAHIGFVFTANDAYAGVDLDAVIQQERLAPVAQEILRRFRTTYAEISPSGTGLHILCKGALAKGYKRALADGIGIEMYNRARYFTITGDAWYAEALPVADCQEALDWLLATYFPAACTVHEGGSAELDVVLTPAAEPPWKKLHALESTNPHWLPTWRQQREMPNDQSASGYDLSLADMMAQANWTPQEMIDTLVYWRTLRGHKPKHLGALCSTVKKGIASVARQQALAQLPDAEDADPDGVRAIILHLTGLSVARYVQTGKYDAAYRVYFSSGDCQVFGSASKARAQASWQDLAQDTLGVPFKTLTAPQWQQFLVALGRIVEREDTEESTLTADYRRYLQAYRRSAFAELSYETLQEGVPLIEEGVLSVNTGHLLGWLHREGVRITDAGMRSILRALGAAPIQMNRRSREGAQCTRRYWQLPRSLSPV